MRRLKQLLIGLAIFFFLFTIVGFFVFPPLLKSLLMNKLSENLHREVSIKNISVNPYTLSLTVKGLLVKDRASSETFVSFDELFVNLQSLSALKRALILKEIRVKQLYIKIVRHQDLSYNFSDLIEKKESKPEEKAKPLGFSLNNIKIIDGSIDFSDEPNKTKHTVRELNITVPFFSTIAYYIDTYVEPSFSAKINETPYSLQGKTKPFSDSRETTFDININDFNIPYYLTYIPFKMNFKILSGMMDAKAKLSFIQSKDKPPSLIVTGDVSLKKLAADDEKKNPLLRLPLLEISIAPTEPIPKIIHLAKVSLQSPELYIRRNQTGAVNIESLFPESGGAKSVPKKEEKPSPLSIDVDEMELKGAKLFFSDLSRSKPFKTALDPIELKVLNFSNGKDKKTTYTLSLRTEAKENMKLEGDFSIDPLWVEGSVEVKSIPLKKYSPYYADSVLFDIEDGKLDFSTRYKYAKKEKESEINLSRMSASLSALRLKKTDETEDFLRIPVLSIKEVGVDLTKKELKIGEFFTQRGEVTVKRLNNGSINLMTLLPSPPTQEGKPEPDKSKGSEKPWLASVRQAIVDRYKIRVEDLMPAQPVTLTAENLNLKAENFSTTKESRGNLSLFFLLDGKGTISTGGTIGIDPLFADLKMDLKNIAISPLQSYFTDKVKINVTSGAVSATGNATLGASENKEIKATFSGEVSLANFSSIDKLQGDDFLKWNSLTFSGIHAGFNPTQMDIKGISLADFYARLSINSDGTFNLQDVMEKKETKAETAPSSQKPTEATPTAPKDKEPPMKINIDAITLQGGRIDFSDRSTQPGYSAKLTEIGGRVSGLSSEEAKLGEVELRGKLDDYAPLEITGKINPLREDLFVDLKVRFKDMDLSPMTPYSGKYIGYTIQKGKLSFDLQYLIVKKKLESQNNVFLDQFTLGDRVESPHATKLPVKLAIALLKDRKGEIRLDIPVRGSLDDPKFSIGKIILQILVNLISKAATSPFALLGAALGGGEELSYLEFDYGSTMITEPNLKKIDTLTKALHDRPSLKMDIEGHVDIEKDREGLKQYLFDKKLKAQKLNEMIKQGLTAIPVDEIKIEPKDYEKYLKMAYKVEKFPKPRNVLGMAKDLPVPEMEKLMLTHIEISDADLRSLASQRATKVKDMILKSGQIEPERIFIIEPKSLVPEKKEKLKDSRADFKLK